MSDIFKKILNFRTPIKAAQTQTQIQTQTQDPSELNTIINTIILESATTNKQTKLSNIMIEIENKFLLIEKYKLLCLLNLVNSIKIIIKNIDKYQIIKGDFEDIFDNEYNLIILDNKIQLYEYPLIKIYLDNIHQYKNKSDLIQLLLNLKKLHLEELYNRNKIYNPDIEKNYKKLYKMGITNEKKYNKYEFFESEKMKIINKEQLEDFFNNLSDVSNIDDYKKIISSNLKQYYIIELCKYFINVIANMFYESYSQSLILKKLVTVLEYKNHFNITDYDINKLLDIFDEFITEINNTKIVK
jgi:hypothetical protein